MNYLITGGAGFIGSHLADALLARGDRVTILDDLSTGSLVNVEHLRNHPRFRCVLGTMLDEPLLERLVGEADAVFHLAAAVGVRLVVESAVRTVQTNIRCTELLLAAACRDRKKVLVTSTSEVYGKSHAVPFREDGDLVLGAPTRTRWSYACSKAVDEILAIAYWREEAVPTVVTRLFNTVGPRQTGQYGMVLPRFVQQALFGEPITVFGDGTQTRCFTHVADTVRALVRLMDCDEAVGEVLNVGSTGEISILELAHRVKGVTQSASPITLVPMSGAYPQGFEDMARRVPCIDKIGALVGWRPEHDVEHTLRSVVEYHRRRIPVAA